MEELKGKQVLVVGMAKSGIATALFLRGRGARVVVSELRAAAQLRAEIPRLMEAGIAIETGGHQERSFLNADWIVVSPGVPTDLPVLERARSEQIPILGEIELAARHLRGRVVAITGSNGKTTTTALTGHLLRGLGHRVQVGGNIGTPLISLVESSDDETINVVEVSSFQLETVESFHAHVAMVLNLSQDHLDRHGDMARYAAAKGRIFRNQTAADYAILNAADEWCRKYAEGAPSQVRWFGRQERLPGEGAFVAAEDLVWREGGRTTKLMPAAAIPLRGAHNTENALAALAAACLIERVGTGGGKETSAALEAGVRSFKAVEHRLEFVARVGEVDYFNDSKATNVDATIKALEAFPGGLWVVLGGKDKNSDYAPLAPLLRARARRVLLIGAASEKIARQLEPLGVAMTRAGTLERAVEIAAGEARKGETVLLAPACASFDQFENYEHRGRVFKQAVAQLVGRAAAANPRRDG